jgi:hypothetical protein
VRDGVQAAWQREPDNITLTAIATSDVPQDVLYSMPTPCSNTMW